MGTDYEQLRKKCLERIERHEKKAENEGYNLFKWMWAAAEAVGATGRAAWTDPKKIAWREYFVPKIRQAVMPQVLMGAHLHLYARIRQIDLSQENSSSTLLQQLKSNICQIEEAYPGTLASVKALMQTSLQVEMDLTNQALQQEEIYGKLASRAELVPIVMAYIGEQLCNGEDRGNAQDASPSKSPRYR